MLGSGTTVPDPARGPAGFLVRRADAAWLVDGGSGTLQRCAAAGVDPRALTGGVFSHHHPDHCGDLAPLLFAMRVGPPPRAVDYPIVAGVGFAAFFARLAAAYGKWIVPGSGQVRIDELTLDGPDARTLDGGVALLSRPADHPASAVHLRFEADGRAVVFSGDTGPNGDLARLADRADLLVCECAAADGHPVRGHLAPSDVAAIVDQARPAEVWLTHLYPDVDPAEAIARVARTGVPVRRAEDQDRWPPVSAGPTSRRSG